VLAAGADGFLLGASLIIAIGAQNAFELRQGLKRKFVFTIALICALSDALLIAAGVAGLGALVRRSEALIVIVTAGGSGRSRLAFRLRPPRLPARRAARLAASGGSANHQPRAGGGGLPGLTFLNPHVYLDTVLLLGSLAARYEGEGRTAYGAGAMLASFVWFFGLGYGARLLAPLFADRRAWRALDVAIGVVMWALAAGLLASLAA